MTRVPVAGPWITERETRYVAEAAATGWYARAGEHVARFERAFAAWVGRKHALALPSCTSALHLALASLGVGPGDEVIVPDITWIATAAPIVYQGATPIFADVDPATWCLSTESVEALLTPRTRAIIGVDLYGGTPAWEELERIASRAGVALLEDAAQGVGALRNGRRAGSFGLASTFSFHGSKTITTGEGGMLVTDDDAILARASKLRDHGRAAGPMITFECDEIGFKYRMTATQAAMGLAQLERVDELVARKRRIFARYAACLGDLPIAMNVEPAGTTNGFWMTTLITPSVSKTKLARVLDRAGIDSRPFFPPLSSQRAFADAEDALRAQDENAVAYSIAPWGLNLPSALSLEDADVDRVADVVRGIVALGREAA